MDAIPFLDPIFREVIIACMIVISKVFPGMKNVFFENYFFLLFLVTEETERGKREWEEMRLTKIENPQGEWMRKRTK